jgi:hypothetical protein
MQHQAAIGLIMLIVGLSVFAILIRVFIRMGRQTDALDKRDRVLTRYDDLAITATHLIVGEGRPRARYPLAGAHAAVEDVGQLSRRITLTRMAAFGVFSLALRKRVDDRSVFLSVTGPAVATVREITVRHHPGARLQARQFATRLNAQSSALAQSAQRT